MSESLRALRSARLLADVSDEWVAFLHYLGDRRGADLDESRGKRAEDIEAALNRVERLIDDGGPDVTPEDQWFQQFERRQDVLGAFEQYRVDRGRPIV